VSALTHTRLRRPPTLAGPAVFVLATLTLVVIVGVPYQRDLVAVWLLLGLLSCSLSDLRGFARGAVGDWLPFIVILIAYDSLRGSAGHLFGVHYLPQLQADQWLFGGSVPTLTLQHWLWHGHVVWYDAIFWCVYLTHFLATPLLAAVLWKLDRQRFRTFAVLVAALSVAGLITYAVFPAAPPWMASQEHLLSPTVRIIPLVWRSLDLHSAGSLIEHGYKYANDVAAVPSLHAGFSLLIAITVWPRRHKWLRPLAALYPLAMAFSLVLGAEHYVFDILLGWMYTAFVVLAVRRLQRRWESRRVSAGAAGTLRGERPHLVPEPAYAESVGGI